MLRPMNERGRLELSESTPTAPFLTAVFNLDLSFRCSTKTLQLQSERDLAQHPVPVRNFK